MESAPKILVVDDDKIIVTLIEKALQPTGYQITKAYDGEEALRKVYEESPDAVILDVTMPGIDGLEVCRRIKQDEQTRVIPVVMLTSKDYIEDKISGFEHGAEDYITKPFNAQELAARMKGIVESNRYRKKRAEEEQLDALEKLVQSISHEVRNPIVAIGGFARRISNRLPPGDVLHTYADHIIREVERLERMLEEILKLKTIVISRERAVNIADILERALGEHAVAITDKHITVQKQIAADLPNIGADSSYLQLAFSHVLLNAIESMGSGGELILSASCESGTIYVSIADTGHGIATSELNQVIRPFYTSKMSGAGMGLTMVKHIAVLHGGDIAIESNKGEGTRVTIILPAEEPQKSREIKSIGV